MANEICSFSAVICLVYLIGGLQLQAVEGSWNSSVASQCSNSSPNSSNAIEFEQPDGNVTLTRSEQCPGPISIVIQVHLAENATGVLPNNRSTVVHVTDQNGKTSTLYPEYENDPNFRLTRSQSEDNDTIELKLFMTMGNGLYFTMTIDIRPRKAEPSCFGPFGVGNSSLKVENVSITSSTVATLQMLTTNFNNCTNFSLPLILELPNGTQYNLQDTLQCMACKPNDLNCSNITYQIIKKNVPEGLVVNKTDECLNHTTVLTTLRLSLVNFTKVFNASTAVVRASQSKSVARPDVCVPIEWNNTVHCDRKCQNNGTCIGLNRCSCTYGWEGNSCIQPVCDPVCLHGECVSPNTCNCSAGWSGTGCDIQSSAPTPASDVWIIGVVFAAVVVIVCLVVVLICVYFCRNGKCKRLLSKRVPKKAETPNDRDDSYTTGNDHSHAPRRDPSGQQSLHLRGTSS